jgi:hypothetical protein
VLLVTLQEIINLIKLKYPFATAYADADFITMINDTQRRIFRTMYKPETTDAYDLLAGNPFYPVSFSPESIIDVVVNGTEYPYQNIEYDAQSYFYYIEQDNTIGIYPTPKEDVTNGLMVFHYKEPSTLSSVSDTPELDQAWHMMFVYHACREFAVMAKDDMVNTFIAEINEMERQFYRSRQARPHQIQDVYGVGRGAR